MSSAPQDRQTDFEVVVLGGGPAGCVAAGILARRSHNVALVRPSRPPAPKLAVSVPPSARRTLEEVGLLDAIDGAGFTENLGNTVWWADEDPRSERFDGPTGFHVCRDDLEAILREPTVSSGVHWWEGYSARTPTRADDRWTVVCEGEDGSQVELTATLIVDATGRRGLLVRDDLRETDRSTTTIAVGRTFEQEGGWGSDDGCTVVESHAGGWAWSLPVDATRRCVTVMFDQRSSDVSGLDAAAILASELEKTKRLRRTLEGSVSVGEAWACPASLYSARRYSGPGFLVAGDAGAFIDPLSSFGVKKALSSGWLAGIVAHTCLVDPAMAEDALTFFEAREASVYHRYREISAPFFASAAAKYGTEFWTLRAESARAAGYADKELEGIADVETVDPDALFAEVPADEVRAAFDVIRAQDELHARRPSSVREIDRPAIEGYRIRQQRHLASERLPQGLRYVRGVDLLRVVEVAPDHAQVPDGWSAYNGVASPVTLPDYLTALSTAFAVGFLEHAP